MSTPQFIAKPFFTPPNEALGFLPECPRILRNHPDNEGGDGQKLGWVAIQHGINEQQGSINVLDIASGDNRNIPLPGRPGFFAETTTPGVVLIGLERRLVSCDLKTAGVEETGITVTDDERVIINDGLPIEEGVLFGTKDLEFNRPIAAIYLFETETRKVRVLLDGQMCSNGKFLRRDAEGMTLIDIDSIPKTISRYQFNANFACLVGSSRIVTTDPMPGSPDGMRPSPDGESVVIAFYNPDAVADGFALQIRLADGAVICRWRIPDSPRVTCPEFVSVNGEVKLLFTTASEGMLLATRRLARRAGTMFIADTLFTKMPESPPLLAF